MFRLFTRSSADSAPHQGWLPNGFDKAEHYINTLLFGVFIITGAVSGFATFTGIQLYLEEVGQPGLSVNAIAVIITIAVTAILVVGWSLLTTYGPEARSSLLKICMMFLAVFMLVITLCVSSLSNLMALVGPSAKVHDWRITNQVQSETVDQLEINALGVTKLLPGWKAEAAKACPAAKQELSGGIVSGTGRGAGPVAFALNGVCKQTTAFVQAMEIAIDDSTTAVKEARVALTAMRLATRDRSGRSVIEREDDYLMAGEILSAAMQKLRAANLTDVLSAGASQVRTSIGGLSQESAFTAKQVETITTIRDGIAGLIESTDVITRSLKANPVPDRQQITSPDYIEGVLNHGWRFVPVAAAALGIDLFALWAFLFMQVLKAGRKQSAHALPASKAPVVTTGSANSPGKE